MNDTFLTKVKMVFFRVPDSKVKHLLVLLYGHWMELFDPLRTRVLYALLHRRIARNHAVVLERLKTQKSIRVLFLIKENSKWGWDSLYQAFEDDPLFEPLVAVIFFGLPKTPDALQKISFAENYAFFESRGMRVVKAYDEDLNQFVDLRDFSPDIVFYEPPWHLPKIQDVPEVSKFALTCHTPYGINVAKNSAQYRLLFLQLVWRQFVESELSKNYLCNNNINKGENIEALGYPKLDIYLDEACVSGDSLWSVSRKEHPSVKRIIYAPHWSFNFLYFATFDWNGEFFLEYAKAHPETDWVFKPHPRLKYALHQDLNWSEMRVEEYYAAWESLPNAGTYDRGGYFDYFKTSDVLITDCASFLGEYVYTKKPVIHLINPDSVGYNPIGQRVSRDFYKAHDLVELEALIDRVILKADDFLYEKRMQALEVVPLTVDGAGFSIKEYIKQSVRNEF